LAVISDGTDGADGGGTAAQKTEPDAATAPAPPAPPAPSQEAPTAPVAASPEPEEDAAEPPAESDDTAAPSAGPRAGGGGGEGGRILSPVVRRLIAEHNLDPEQIEGTGAGGRITRSDVLAVIDRRNGADGRRTELVQTGPAATGPAATGPAPTAPSPTAPSPTAQAAASAPSAPTSAAAPAAAPAARPAPTESVVTDGERDTVVPFTNIRRRTAEHMVRSKQTSAHTTVGVEVDYVGVEKVRTAEKTRFREAEGFSLTYLPFVTRAVVDALEDFPNVNSSVGDNALIVHHDLNIGIAVDLDFQGLLVPVIHQADGKRLRALAREISELAAKARNKRLTMDDISGGTFTITNAGPFGTFFTVPVINQPQVAILSTDGVRKRPVAIELPDGSDGIAIHPVGNLVMTWDHRAFDGAYAAAFVAAVKKIVETRDWAAEL
jgi:pyruvate dehydrogenase E2 component (dihydrolipoamide acetyltransferase)